MNLPFSSRNSAKMSAAEDSEPIEGPSDNNDGPPSTLLDDTNWGTVYTLSSSCSRLDFELYSIRVNRQHENRAKILGGGEGWRWLDWLYLLLGVLLNEGSTEQRSFAFSQPEQGAGNFWLALHFT